MKWKFHVRCGVGEKIEIISKFYLSLFIGLQLKGIGDKGFDINQAKMKNPRDIELVILKNRNGATGKKITFEYYPFFNYFKEV